MRAAGFDNGKYLAEQTEAIHERLNRFPRLYLEFGGKLLFDYHAARVLPGYDPNVKLRLLQRLSDQAEVILCLHAGDIERKKVRADFGITYDSDALKLIDDLRDAGINVMAVVITRYDGQPAVRTFISKLERRHMRVVTHRAIPGYPTDVDMIVSADGYGSNPYIPATKPLVVVTAPGPGSGKLATCLNQLYHEHRRGVNAGYAKFETFPIWNLPLKHPVNVAYEAATADIRDFNQIDPFHLEVYGKTTVNYNRDVEAFPVLRRILTRLLADKDTYRSPTDMGVNRAGYGIIDDAATRAAARQEIIRRYFRYSCEYVLGLTDRETVERVELLLAEVGVRPEDRTVVTPAREAALSAQRDGKGHDGIFCGAAVELADGTVVTGRNSPLMHAASSVVLNAIKRLSEIPDRIHLLSPSITEAVGTLKRDILAGKTESMNLEETLIALSISSATNPATQLAMEQLKQLRGCDMHMTHIPAPGDEAGLRRLGIHLTSDPNFPSRNFFAG